MHHFLWLNAEKFSLDSYGDTNQIWFKHLLFMTEHKKLCLALPINQNYNDALKWWFCGSRSQREGWLVWTLAENSIVYLISSIFLLSNLQSNDTFIVVCFDYELHRNTIHSMVDVPPHEERPYSFYFGFVGDDVDKCRRLCEVERDCFR